MVERGVKGAPRPPVGTDAELAAQLRRFASGLFEMADLAHRYGRHLSILDQAKLARAIDAADEVLTAYRRLLSQARDQAEREQTATPDPPSLSLLPPLPEAPGQQSPADDTPSARPPRRKYVRAEIDECLLVQLHEQGATDPELATALGCRVDQVRTVRRRFGLTHNYRATQRVAARRRRMLPPASSDVDAVTPQTDQQCGQDCAGGAISVPDGAQGVSAAFVDPGAF